MDPVAEILDCQGPRFADVWHDLFDASAKHEATGLGPRSAPRRLLDTAAKALQSWRPQAAARASRHVASMLKGGGVSDIALAGFCLHGFVTAMFWRCFDMDVASPSSAVAQCLIGLTSGPIDSDLWGPLEFSESARWPLKTLDVRLLHEHWTDCASQRVDMCSDVSAQELRRRLSLHVWGGEEPARPILGAAYAQQRVQLQLATDSVPPTLRWRDDTQSPLQLSVIGSHLGSNMEPLSLLMASLKASEVQSDVIVYGTIYPWPEMMCQLFGHCERNQYIEEAVGMLVRQMYKPNWEPSELLRILHLALASDAALQRTELFLCAQPMALCALLRALTERPMLLYQAFPLVGATPVAHMDMILLNFREMLRAPQRSAFVVYSEFLAVQFERQTGMRPLCIRPHSLYATQAATYSPDRENPRVLVSRTAGWARDGALALVHLTEAYAERDLRPGTRLRFIFLGMNRPPSETVAGIIDPFGYAELRRFRAAVFFPWDMGMLMLNELYNMGVPILVPSRAWMSSIIKRMLEYTDFGWWQFRQESAVALPADGGSGGKAEVWPWVGANSTVASVLELYDLTDFVRWPHITSFSSLPDLTAKLLSLDFDAASAAQLEWGEKALPFSLDILGRTLGSLLSDSAPPEAGMSSCV